MVWVMFDLFMNKNFNLLLIMKNLILFALNYDNFNFICLNCDNSNLELELEFVFVFVFVYDFTDCVIHE